MKHLIYLFLIMSRVVSAQYHFDFEDGALNGWLQYPGDRWEITNLDSTGYSLHHAYDNTEAATDIIAKMLMYADPSDTLKLSFRVRHGYNPSSGNNWQCVLLADSLYENWPGSRSSGIMLGVNYRGSDDLIRLWQLDRGELIEIIVSEFNYQETAGTESYAPLKLQRIPDGTWELYLDEKDQRLLGRGMEQVVNNGKYFAFRYNYSSAQDRKLWIDDVSLQGGFFQDTLPPSIREHSTMGQNHILLYFSEAVKLSRNSSFSWDDYHADSVIHEGDELYLFFNEKFPNRVMQKLHVGGMVDMEGNVMEDTIICFMADIADFGDIVINEVMTDPEPSVYLPASEYVELYNNHSDTICLDEWSLKVNGKFYEIGSCCLPPFSYILLCGIGEAAGFDTNRVLEVWTTKSVFPNSGGEIQLTDNFERLIHRVNYEEESFCNEMKDEGGWSLEQIDPGYLCGGEKNWSFSLDWKGGTPGTVNSLNGKTYDHEEPVLKYHGATSGGVELFFSEAVIISEDSPGLFLLEEHLLQAKMLTDPLVSESLFIPAALDSGVVYILEVSNIEDCVSNALEELVINFQLPEKPGSGDILITEVMFDPLPGGNEYLELYNNGDKALDINDLLFSISASPAGSAKLSGLSDEHHIMDPGSYVVFCGNEELLRGEWQLEYEIDVVRVKGWKALPNDESCISISDRSGNFIDQFCYSSGLHHDILDDACGVALERIHFAECNIGELCWASAAYSKNHGTPGRINSQHMDRMNEIEEIVLSPRVFSPDMDGWEDILDIGFPGYLAGGCLDIFITDLYGSFIKVLVSRAIVGARDHVFWDGRDSNGYLVSPGIYILHIKIAGETSTYSVRKSCAVKYRN